MLMGLPRGEPGHRASCIRPEQLLKVESLPDLTDFFATLQSPITPLLPSFWTGRRSSPARRPRSAAAGALWTTALASVVVLRGERTMVFLRLQ
jgi:hypothetical protein